MTRSNADLGHELPNVRITHAKLGECMHHACETVCVSEVHTTPHVCRPSIASQICIVINHVEAFPRIAHV